MAPFQLVKTIHGAKKAVTRISFCRYESMDLEPISHRKIHVARAFTVDSMPPQA
jgi:hypothetical protein